MYTYLCRFLYIGDTSSHSANIPDEVGHICLVESDSNELEKLPRYKLIKYWKIYELLEEHGCESVSLELLSDDDISEYSGIDTMTINIKDLD